MASLTKRKIKTKKGVTRRYYITWYQGKKKCFVSTGESQRDKAEMFFRDWQNLPKSNLTLSEFSDEIIKYARTNYTIGTYKIYRRAFENFLKLKGNVPLKLIRLQDIENYKELRKQTVSNTTINIDVRCFKSAFNLAIDFGYIDKNPFQKCKQLKEYEKDNKTFTTMQIEAILNASKPLSLHKAIIISLYSGLRLNEVINLKFKHISNGFIGVVNSETFKTKTGKKREIPLNDEIKKLFDFPSLPDNYVLGKKFDKSYITRRFHKLLISLDIHGLTFHNLRHTFLSRLGNDGVPVKIIQEIAGHSTVLMTMKYTHTDLEQKQKAVKFNYI